MSACTTVQFNFAYTSIPTMGRRDCTEPQCLFKNALQLYLYLHPPYGPYSLYRTSEPVQSYTFTLPLSLLPYWPYSLYRASVPVQRCTLPLPMPLLPYGPYCLYRASVPVQRCTLILPLPLRTLWTVQPVQSLSAFSTLHFTMTYTSKHL